MPISSDIHILTSRDLDALTNEAFQRGVRRGRFEQRMDDGKEPVARNCKNWQNGVCNSCGAQHQGCEVSGDFKCPNFVIR